MNVDELLAEADTALTRAETQVSSHPQESCKQFQTGASCLCRAYLMTQGMDNPDTGTLASLFQQCLTKNEEFESIRDEINYLNNSDLAELDGDVLCDAANEIWDFIIDLLPEEEG